MPTLTPTELETEIAARKAHLARLDQMRIALASATIEATETLESIAKDEEVKPNLRVRASDKILTYHEKLEAIESDNRVKTMEDFAGKPCIRPPDDPGDSPQVERTLRLLLVKFLDRLTEAVFVGIATLSNVSKDANVNPDIRIRAADRLFAYHIRLSKGEREEADIRYLEGHSDAQRQAALQSYDPVDRSTDPVAQQPPQLQGTTLRVLPGWVKVSAGHSVGKLSSERRPELWRVLSCLG